MKVTVRAVNLIKENFIRLDVRNEKRGTLSCNACL